MSLELKLLIEHDDFELKVDERLPSQGVTAIFGPSGSGKTTLLRAIAGLLENTHGQVKFDGEVWQDNSYAVPTHLRRLAFVFQEPSLFEHLTVRENLEYAFKRVANDERKITPDQLINELGLRPLLSRNTQTLSGGEKQRIAIARALCSNPKLLLMDEPLSALDRNVKNEILPMLTTLHQKFKIPIVYVSHALDEVARISDHLVLIEKGRIVESGDIQSMLTQLNLSLAKGIDAESLVDAVVVEHDDEFQLTYLDSPIGKFSVLKRPLAVGSTVRILLAARDVSITLERQRDTSILNIFSAVVDQIEPADGAQVTLRLLANGIPILARLTKKSTSLMNLKIGDSVYLQAKSVAIL